MHDTTGPPKDAVPVTTRPGRCSVHAGSPAVGVCSGCHRSLCLACAIPVRGLLVGAECLARFVEDAPSVEPPAGPAPRRGDVATIAGFGVVAVLSLFPWTRFGGSSFLGAWDGGWSLPAVVAGTGGLILSVAGWVRPRAAAMEAAVYGVLAVVAGVACILYRFRPPLLAGASLLPLFAFLGAVLALGGAVWKAGGLRAPAPRWR